MIRTIFHQLWNQRQQNGWIFAELIIVSFFLWTVIDPIYVLTANYCIDRGYDTTGRYVVQLNNYDASNGNYRKELDSVSLTKEAYLRIIRTIRELPEVDSYVIVNSGSIPNGRSWSGSQVYADTASFSGKDEGYVHTQWYEFVSDDGGNLFRTYGMKDALTGGDLVLPEDGKPYVFISENLARSLFGTSNAAGKKIYESDKRETTVAGVFRDYKHRDYEQPYPLLVCMEKGLRASRYMHWAYNIVFKLKEGVDAEAFEARFRKEVAPLLSEGNLFLQSLNSFAALSEKYAASSGRTNKLRLQYALTGFALLCIFLGMVGTFWIRCNARRKEIGVMRSMGASRSGICRQFLTESWLLVTAAALITVPLLLHHACVSGLYVVEQGDMVRNMEYGQNCFGIHFGIVLLLSYVLLLGIALTGTYIPVQRAVKTLPAEALRDE